MLLAYLINPNMQDYSLEALLLQYLGIKKTLDRTKQQLSLLSDSEPSANSLAEDAALTRQLKKVLLDMIKRSNIETLYKEIEMPLINVLADMETAGIMIDTKRFNELSKEIEIYIQSLIEKIYALAGQEFNINSPKQVQEILFDKLKLIPSKKTKFGYSTDIGVLEALALKHDLPGEILNYRTLTKLKNTYLDALTAQVNPKTG
ncbi:DNA-directed DNA polymerase, family A domain protein [Candidatus Magnetoovum chiemensis]|nr:DNA-directed DNA polymerase, family A domain protein [Candidatus Magnetoovum chiemensis]